MINGNDCEKEKKLKGEMPLGVFFLINGDDIVRREAQVPKEIDGLRRWGLMCSSNIRNSFLILKIY